MSKAPTAFRTISEVSDELDVPKHVLRFWEMKFPQIKPMKRGGGRRYYRPEDMDLLQGICHLLHAEAYTIKGVQKILRERGVDTVKEMGDRQAAHKAGQKSAAKSLTRAGITPTPPTAKAAEAKRRQGANTTPADQEPAAAVATAKARATPRTPVAGAPKTAATAARKATPPPAARSRQPAATPDAAIVDALNRAILELQACRSALLGTPAAKKPRARAASQVRN